MELYFKSKVRNCDAVCEMKEGKFIVKKGSIISPKISHFKVSKQVVSARGDKNIVGKDNVTLKDVVFKSSSTAAQFVSGASVNGKVAWKDKNKNNLKKIEKAED